MKKKLNLENLKVKSFVTTLESDSAHTVAGGVPNDGTAVEKISIQADCLSDWNGPCQPSEYMTACMSQNLDCFSEVEKKK
jgi:hypothetical protein